MKDILHKVWTLYKITKLYTLPESYIFIHPRLYTYIIYAVKKFREYYIFNRVNSANIRFLTHFSNILSVLTFFELQHKNTLITYKAT